MWHRNQKNHGIFKDILLNSRGIKKQEKISGEKYNKNSIWVLILDNLITGKNETKKKKEITQTALQYAAENTMGDTYEELGSFPDIRYKKKNGAYI